MSTEQTILTAFRTQVRKVPNRVALRFRDESVSYRALDQESNRIANYLIEKGVKKGDFVAFVIDMAPLLLETILGIAKTGAAYVPIDPNLPDERKEFIVRDSEAKLLLTTSDRATALKGNASTVLLDKEVAAIKKASDAAPRRKIQSDDLLYVIYTSGSTGVPKGVMVPHRGVVNIAKNTGYVDFEKPQTFLLQAQISFDISAYEIYASLLNGATLAIAEPMKPTVDSVIEAVRRYEVTTLQLSTGLFHMVVDARVEALTSLGTLFGCGDVMLPHLAEKAARELPNTRVINAYGPTENTIFSTLYEVPKGYTFSAGVPIGKAIKGIETYVLDHHDRRVENGQTGELVVGGVNVARGYWKRPDITEERFIPNPLTNRPEDILYKTGDLVRLAADGNFEYLGRIDQQVKIRGFRIELGDIESTILKNPAIKFCAVAAHEVTPGDKRLMAYVVMQEKGSLNLDAFRQFISEHLPEYMIPAHVMELDALPLNPNGKVDRKALPIVIERPELSVDYEAPASEREQRIAEAWSKVLGVERIGRQDNFFDLGGNSMLAARVTVRLQDILSTNLSASVVYEHPTIMQLARIGGQDQADELDLAAEVQLDAAIQPETPFVAKRYKQQHAFLTGGTGFLGAYLIQGLLQQKGMKKLYCLVRADDASEGLKRIKLNMEKYLLWDDTYESRLVAVPGHLDRPQLGLEPGEYETLSRTVDTIYHNGAKVNYVQSYQLHKAANVTGTQRILEFAAHRVTKPVHFLSTIVSFGPLGFLSHVKTLYEDDDLDRSEHVLYYDMGYAQSKWVAEKIMLLARDRGIPTTIMRPGFIMGESERGVSNTDDFVGRLFKGCIALGAYPDLPRQRKEHAPVDYMAGAVIQIAADAKNLNKNYHLVPPTKETVDFNDLFEAVKKQFGYEMKALPFSEWARALADANDPGNPLTTFLPLFFEKKYKNRTVWELYENMSAYDSTNTQKALEGSSVACTPLDAALLRKYFDYMIDIGFIPEAPNDLRGVADAAQQLEIA
ncbi:MAG TPA: amino acid adenylation domain-containing protein [Candidatus Saccharimonadales bacterium]|nr:amino acid adenylation domain-containing protein [Candidatus Saccharimonadales bacterium]